MSATNKILRVVINPIFHPFCLRQIASFKYCLLPQLFVKPYNVHIDVHGIVLSKMKRRRQEKGLAKTGGQIQYGMEENEG